MCRTCGKDLAAGTSAGYDSATKTVICIPCMGIGAVETTFDAGTAGASADREFVKRKTKRDTRIRAAHPHLGGLILALSDEPQTTKAWATGARGEVILGKRLDTLTSRGFHVLHDRRIPGTKANIDHIVVGQSGVFVIDAKRYAGRPSLRVEGGILRPRTETLVVGSRDCSKLVDGVLRQVSNVTSALGSVGIHDVPISGMLCFVEADWPLIGGNFTVASVDVLWPAKAIEQIMKPGPLNAGGVDAVARALAAHFPLA